MKKIVKDYLSDKLKLELWQIVGVLCLVFVFAGMFGWLYEFILYYFNSGMTTWYMRGSNFIPWINIYATGSIMIIFLTYKFRKKPWLVFLIAVVSTGILEYCTGLVMDKIFNLRCWDYNTEILSFGSIGGYVCLRSVLIFGLCGLMLMYLILPIFIKLSQVMNKKVFLTISIVLFSIFLFDELYNLLFARWLGLPRATDIYSGLGLKYMKYR
jgi:uncharacterized membrane protein